MASKPMHDLLKKTLQRCYLEDITHAHEYGLTVSMQKQTGEIVLFFKTDSDKGRKALKLVGEGFKICDYLVLYTKEVKSNEVVCFLELKGSNLEDAAAQVLQTCQHLKALSRIAIETQYHETILWKACICMHSQASNMRKKVADALQKEFGKGNIRIKHGVKHDKNLGEFLRERV